VKCALGLTVLPEVQEQEIGADLLFIELVENGNGELAQDLSSAAALSLKMDLGIIPFTPFLPSTT
jgi:hypothetical protein